jgi:predicted nucleotidyltransferase
MSRVDPIPADLAEALEGIFRSAAGSAVASAYLFGSRATSRAHHESDVDLGVLLRGPVCRSARDRFEERLRLIAELGRGLGSNAVDLLVLNDVPPTLGRRIVTEGRRVFCADPAADHAFVRDVQLRAADVEPFLRRLRRVKHAALAR